ncbi:MAG: thiamine-phosphate kinase [Acidobacteriota bacterium]
MRTEFDFIRSIKKKYDLKHVGDDCAVLPKDAKTDLVVTADMLVEDVDFRLEWTAAESLGAKSLAVSLSDIAAMGGTPRWAMLSIAVPPALWKRKTFIDDFYEGWFKLARQYRVDLIGGDVSRTSDKLVIDSIVTGETAKGRAVLRSGAEPGDSIFVTGSLGGAAAGLELLKSGRRTTSPAAKKGRLIERQLRPTPRVEAGKYLSVRRWAKAMIDISDGFAADLHHLCDASGVGALIEIDRIPIDENLDGMTADQKLKFALGGGEDFELLFTSDRKVFSQAELPQITRVGEITESARVVEVVRDGRRKFLPPFGYRHF